MTEVQAVGSLTALQEVGVKLANIPTIGRGVERKKISGLLQLQPEKRAGAKW